MQPQRLLNGTRRHTVIYTNITVYETAAAAFRTERIKNLNYYDYYFDCFLIFFSRIESAYFF